MVERMSSGVSWLRSEAAVYSGGTAADTSASLVRWQQGEQSVMLSRQAWRVIHEIHYIIRIWLCSGKVPEKKMYLDYTCIQQKRGLLTGYQFLYKSNIYKSVTTHTSQVSHVVTVVSSEMKYTKLNKSHIVDISLLIFICIRLVLR